MAADAELGFGSKFQTGDGLSPETFSNMAFVTSISGPGLARDSIDASHMLSPDEWRQFIAGLKDGGEISLELNFRPGGSAITVLLAELNLPSAEATKSRRVLFPDTSYFEFEAYLTGVEPEDPFDDKMTASATFKLSGRPFLTQV